MPGAAPRPEGLAGPHAATLAGGSASVTGNRPFGCTGVVAALFLVALTACSKAPETAGLTVLLPQPPTTLDPRHASDAASARLARLLFQPLVDFDAEYRPRPVLADWRAMAPDHYRLRLRDDRSNFHDGSPVTAEDVRATYASVLDPASASLLAGSLAGIERIEVLDPQTLDFHLSADDPLFPGRLTLGILPARLAAPTQRAGTTSATGTTASTADISDRGGSGDTGLVGSGPFRLVQRLPGGDLLLERRSDGLPVWLRGLQDPLTRLRRIAAGEADIAQGELGSVVLEWARGQSGLQVLATPGDSLSYIGLNLRDPRLADVRLRRALSLALDRQRLSARLLNGHARPAVGLLGPGHWAGDGGAGRLAAQGDPAAASALLESIGITPATPLRLTLATSANPERLRLAAALAAELEPYGIQLRIQSSDWAAFYAAVRSGRFQACLLQWVGLKLPDVYRYAFHSASTPPVGANRGGVHDPALDALIEAAEALPEARAASAWRAVRDHVADTLPQIPLWFEDATAVVGPRVHHYALSADGSLDGLATVRVE